MVDEPIIVEAITESGPIVVEVLVDVVPDVIEVEVPGPQGPSGNAAQAYEHLQQVPSDLWSVPHNLGVRPIVSIRTLGGEEVDASVLHLSENVLQVRFNEPLAGIARCM